MKSLETTVMDSQSKPHAVCIPFPAQGHMTPLLNLAKLLHNTGFHITFINTQYNHNRLTQSTGPLSGLPDFRFETIPDGLPPADTNTTTQHVPSLIQSTSINCLGPFKEIIHKLNHTSGAPPVTCIVSDGVMSFTLKASEELGIPNVMFWTTSACGFMGYKQCVNLMDKGLVPFKDSSYLTNGYLETMVEWIPGKKCIAMKDLPMLIRTTDPNNIVTNFLKQEIEASSRATAIILHTFEELEHNILDALSSMFPCSIYPIGPLHLHLNQIKEKEGLEKIRSSLWKEEDGCIEWLNSKEPKSVLYVNFGSVRVMSKEQLVELAWGLANSQQNFLWIVRPDLVGEGIESLPKEFIAETKERGLLASWCPQEKVLSHSSVRGFLTHSGWNSTIESITAGVPMICWPFSSEQRTNSLYCCADWGIGMRLGSDDISRIEVERVVRELVQGEKSELMKEKAKNWKRKAQDATNPGGSSYLNLERLVHEVLQFK